MERERVKGAARRRAPEAACVQSHGGSSDARTASPPAFSRLAIWRTLLSAFSACDIAGVLMQIARDLARVSCGAALSSDRAHIAVALRSAVEQRTSVVHGAAGPEQLAVGADVGAALPIPVEVRA